MAESFRENVKKSGPGNFCNKHQSLLHFVRELIEKKLLLIKAATKASTHKIKLNLERLKVKSQHLSTCIIIPESSRLCRERSVVVVDILH